MREESDERRVMEMVPLGLVSFPKIDEDGDETVDVG